ncbi:BH3459 [Halalkalibacterium halodurans C-125]|uniref:BH3459 protein n=1 Tax=Halalkalibacterium halodurans (strain ATCC BAA-125 / DSM 18197 / FERM 7344 / JCM 9153 / C-125) TaxID=272558 RepID=Q9K7A8_HALH5|nr:BH3459 [Halalkalibacterium halodurans C-125]
MDTLESDLSDVHTIEFVDQDGEVVAIAEKPF